MRRVAAGLVAALAVSAAQAQALRPERPEGCRDAVVAGYEHYDITATRGGDGGTVDWVGCAPGAAIYTAGAGSYAVAGSRWSIARGGLSLHPRETWWVGGDLAVGRGTSDAGSFDYLTTRATFTVRPLPALFARLEHQYVDIDASRGSVFKAAAIVQPVTPLLIEAGVERSAGGNLGTRSRHLRIDWVAAPARAFAGVVRGRTTPQPVDILGSERAPDAVSREWFAGVAFAIAGGEVMLTYDELRGDASRRRTLGATVRWTLP